MKVTGQFPLPTDSGMTDRNSVRMSVTGRSVWRMLIGLTMMLVSGIARFETAHQHNTDKDCIYEYFSHNKSGFFSTPSYPHHYPSNTTCLYSFYGQESERVRITFAQIDLNYPIGDPRHPDDCNDVDTVTIRTLPLAVDQKSSIISVYCGSKKPPKVMSSSNYLLVTFRSNIDSTSTGFLAQYEFIRDFGIKSGEQDFESECRFVYRSSKAYNGSFHSPNYPGLYPKNTECQYVFHGRPGERVEIIFRYFEVEGIPPMCSEDSDSDYVELTNSLSEFNSRSGQRHEESTGASTRYCVTKADHSRKTFASDGNFFRVTFKSNSVYDANGFDAVYQFVTHRQEMKLGSSSSSFHCIRQERCVITILTYILVILITECVLQIRHSKQ